MSVDPLPKLRYTLDEVVNILHLSKGTLHARIKAGELVIHKDGRRDFVTVEELNRYVASKATPQFPKAA